jgi:excisionase family DNA binding protein
MALVLTRVCTRGLYRDPSTLVEISFVCRVALRTAGALFPVTETNKEEHMGARLTYTVPEVAELLGISRSSAYECVRRGEIPALTLGRRVVIAKATIDTMLNVTAHDLEAGEATP